MDPSRSSLGKTDGIPTSNYEPDERTATILAAARKKDPNIRPRGEPNWRAGPLGSTVFVRNLNFMVNCRRFRRVFQKVGVVRYAAV